MSTNSNSSLLEDHGKLSPLETLSNNFAEAKCVELWSKIYSTLVILRKFCISAAHGRGCGKSPIQDLCCTNGIAVSLLPTCHKACPPHVGVGFCWRKGFSTFSHEHCSWMDLNSLKGKGREWLAAFRGYSCQVKVGKEKDIKALI